MKGSIVLAIIFAVIAAGCVIAELFISGRIADIWVTTGAIFAFAAFIITLVAYVNKAAK
ncbi:MAG: hypothetical protein J1E38_04970 [Paramuribaculum sp.]|nr:hypothetical protein [Paramuribaculum sp.]